MAAWRPETAARQQFGPGDLAADGTVAAELTQWLGERELDLASTTIRQLRVELHLATEAVGRDQ